MTTFAGRTVPADVVIIGIPLGTWAAPSRTALYPARLSWLELTSIDCARLNLRGIISIESSVMFDERQSLTNCGLRKGSETHARLVPSFIPSTPGNRIVMMVPHESASSLVPMVAPASSYAESA